MGPSPQLEELLQEHQVSYELRHHEKCMTARQLAEVEHINPHQVAKVIVMRSPKQQYYMMVLPADYTIDMKAVHSMLGENLTFATEQEMQGLFPDCEVGAMPPFGSLYNMNLIVERDLADDAEIEFNAGSHEDAIRMSYADWSQVAQPAVAHFGTVRH